MRLPADTASQPLVTAGVARLALSITTSTILACSQTVTVDAHDEATLVTDPVNVKQRGVTHVTHLPHSLDCSLPRNLGCKTIWSQLKTHSEIISNTAQNRSIYPLYCWSYNVIIWRTEHVTSKGTNCKMQVQVKRSYFYI